MDIPYLIPILSSYMDNQSFKRYSMTCKTIKYMNEQDTLISIINTNNYALLLSLDLKTLQQISYINRRINTLIRKNSFWYLKLEQDYLPYINKWVNKKSYLGRIIYQDIIQNSKDYYMFYYHYTLYNNLKENTIDDLINLFKMINHQKMQLNHILQIVSITYQDDTLESRVKTLKCELWSNQLVIMSLIPFDVDIKFNYDILTASFTYNTKIYELFIYLIKPNLLGLINAFTYILKR